MSISIGFHTYCPIMTSSILPQVVQTSSWSISLNGHFNNGSEVWYPREDLKPWPDVIIVKLPVVKAAIVTGTTWLQSMVPGAWDPDQEQLGSVSNTMGWPGPHICLLITSNKKVSMKCQLEHCSRTSRESPQYWLQLQCICEPHAH